MPSRPGPEPSTDGSRDRLYLWLAGLFVAALLTADLIAGRFLRIAGRDIGAGMLAFPLTFVITDITNEFFGPRATRRLTYLGLGAAVFSFAIINVALALPVSPETPLSDGAFRETFGWSARAYVASLSAYTLGQLLDIAIFSGLRRLTKERLLWLRATGSTILSQGVDTLVVTWVLLGGTKSTGFILGVARDSYALKVLIAIALTPVIYGSHALVARAFARRA
jgi:hypothetical protein